MANILAVDDDEELRALLKIALERDGHRVTTLSAGIQLQAEHCGWADCILLDVMMPDESGFETCARIRSLTSQPILFLTAKAEEIDVLTGLGKGGDDYIVKPFRLTELRARVNAHLRRQQRPNHTRLCRGGLEFDMAAKSARVSGKPVPFTKSEYGICEHLALRPGQVFSKEQIYEAVFGFEGMADDSAITEHVKNIRAKLKRWGLSPIETIWGLGYRWKEEG